MGDLLGSPCVAFLFSFYFLFVLSRVASANGVIMYARTRRLHRSFSNYEMESLKLNLIILMKLNRLKIAPFYFLFALPRVASANGVIMYARTRRLHRSFSNYEMESLKLNLIILMKLNRLKIAPFYFLFALPRVASANGVIMYARTRRLHRSFSNYEMESLKLNLIILMKLNRLKIAPFYFLFALPRVASANGVIMYARTRRLHRSFSNYEMESLKLNLIILMKLNRLKIAPFYFLFALPRVASANGVIMYARTRRLHRSFSNYEMESLKLNLIILMKLNRLKIAPFYFLFALPRVASANGVIMYARTRRLHRSFSNYEMESLKLNLIILMKLNLLKIAPFYFLFALPRVASANGVIMYARTRRLHRSFSNYEMESLKLNLIILM